MMYLGDFNAGDTVRFMWNSNDSNGASITRSTNGTISVYQNGNVTQSTTGVTDTEDFDSLTGVHLVAVDTSADGTFYAAGRDFAIVLSAATIDTRTVNAVLAHFSIAARSALRPTVATRTLDVSAGGEAGIDWANVGSPTTALNLSGTNIDPDQVVASVTGAVTAGTVSDKTGYSLTAGEHTNIAADAQTGLTAQGYTTTRAGYLDTLNGLVAAVWANVTRVLTAGTNIVLAKGTGVTGFNDLSAAQVNSEVDTALATDTYAEPGSVPAATSSLKDKIGWLFTLARNKRTTTSTTDTVRNDADTASIATSTISDDGTTFTRSEYT